MARDGSRTFKVDQLGPPKGPDGIQRNEQVHDFEGIETHHPKGNRDAHMVEGSIIGTEDQKPSYRGGDRSYAFIGGEFQEVIDQSTDKYGSLKSDQVLLVKDFILEDPSPPTGTRARAVGVPAPTAGYVSLVRDSGGMVEILDGKDGDVVARVPHWIHLGENGKHHRVR